MQLQYLAKATIPNPSYTLRPGWVAAFWEADGGFFNQIIVAPDFPIWGEIEAVCQKMP